MTIVITGRPDVPPAVYSSPSCFTMNQSQKVWKNLTTLKCSGAQNQVRRTATGQNLNDAQFILKCDGQRDQTFIFQKLEPKIKRVLG